MSLRWQYPQLADPFEAIAIGVDTWLPPVNRPGGVRRRARPFVQYLEPRVDIPAGVGVDTWLPPVNEAGRRIRRRRLHGLSVLPEGGIAIGLDTWAPPAPGRGVTRRLTRPFVQLIPPPTDIADVAAIGVDTWMVQFHYPRRARRAVEHPPAQFPLQPLAGVETWMPPASVPFRERPPQRQTPIQFLDAFVAAANVDTWAVQPIEIPKRKRRFRVMPQALYMIVGPFTELPPEPEPEAVTTEGFVPHGRDGLPGLEPPPDLIEWIGGKEWCRQRNECPSTKASRGPSDPRRKR